MEILVVVVLLIVAVVGLNVHATNERRRRLMAKYGDALIVEKIMKKIIWQGMSSEQLLDAIGRPIVIDEKVYKTKTVHTYKYQQDGSRSFRTRVKVENGEVVGWEQR